MGKAAVHTAIQWVPGGLAALVTGVATLGGEKVRTQIWSAVVAAAHDTQNIIVAVLIVIIWGLLWCVTRSGAEAKPATQPTVTQNVTSHGQTGGQTAHTILNREPDPVPQRCLSKTQIEAITRVLATNSFKGTITEIQYASKESALYLAQIASVFEKSGWKRQTFCTLSRPTVVGVRVSYIGRASNLYDVAVKSLKAAGLEFEEGAHEGLETDIAIDVGTIEMTAFQKAADRWPE